MHFSSRRIGNVTRKPLGVPPASPQRRWASVSVVPAPRSHPPACAEPSADFSPLLSLLPRPSSSLGVGLHAACGPACAAAGAVPTEAGVAGPGGAKMRPSAVPRRYGCEVGDVEGLDSPASPEMGPAEGTPILPLAHWTQPLGRGMGPTPKPCSPSRVCSGCRKQMGSRAGWEPAVLCPSLREGEGGNG